MANMLAMPLAGGLLPKKPVSGDPTLGAADYGVAPPATSFASPKPNALATAPAAPPQANPYAQAMAPKPKQNEMLGGAINGFMRGFRPEQWQADQDKTKADGAERAKNTLALMQQQRALPAEQRAAWWQQNADQIGQIVGGDVKSLAMDENSFSDQAMDGQIAMISAKLGIAPEKPKNPIEINGQLVDPNTREVLGDYRTPEKANDGSNIRQVGNQIVERQQDGSWKPVYTGSNAEETARAFQGFIDAQTGEQMVVMSNGVARGTGRTAYIPAQITDMGGVPTAVDKRTLGTTPLSPLAGVAGNTAAIASAGVQGKAQGQAAFDLPTIEMRSQAAMRSVDDLKGRNIGTRFGMQGKLYAIPGTEGADVQALIGQVTSQAFLNAFDQLRGAGAITEREGQAATAAITRLQNQNITIGEALKAMDELQTYYKTGLEVARMKSTKAPVLPNMPAGATQPNQNQPARISGDDEFDALPSGARFMGPDGVVRVKP